MDPRERTQDWQEGIRAAMRGMQAGLWTSMPGIIQDYDPATLTVSVQPAIRGKYRNQQGKFSDIDLPKLIYCPVMFPGGGNFLFTFPLAEGDECDVIFAARCVDAWWQSGGVQNQLELRFHDLSDGFCFPKCYSKPNVPEDISTTTAQLRTKDATTILEIDGGVINIKGNLAVSGNIVAGSGFTGSFSTSTGQTVMVVGGIIVGVF